MIDYFLFLVILLLNFFKIEISTNLDHNNDGKLEIELDSIKIMSNQLW